MLALGLGRAHGLIAPRPTLLRTTLPAFWSAPSTARTAAMCSPAVTPPLDDAGVPPRMLSKAWFKKWATFDKDKIKTLGVDAFFTYGVVSNLNVGFMTALAWGTFSKTSGLSPLAVGQWKGFLATYTALYLSLGTVLRPFRMAFAVGLTPLYTRTVARLRDRLPFRESNPQLNRTLALVSISLLFNFVGTFSLVGLGAWVAGIVTGVPAFPAGAKILGWTL